MKIRPAVPDDAKAIAEVQVAAWRAAYHGHMPDTYLRSLSVDQKARSWRRGLEQPGPGTALVCERDGQAVGFCVYGPSRDEDARDHPTGELVAMNVHPQCWRQGLGKAICEVVLAEAAKQDWESLTLWVLTENHAARRLYEKLGFVSDRVERSDTKLTGHPLHETRYRKRLR
jgi:ribosomal protein S18 acetylase RimI-like enzyme